MLPGISSVGLHNKVRDGSGVQYYLTIEHDNLIGGNDGCLLAELPVGYCTVENVTVL